MIKKERSNDGFIELRLQGGNIKAGSGVAALNTSEDKL